MRAHFFHRRPARRANARLFNLLAIFFMLRRAQNFGNDFVGTAYEYARADLDVLSRNIPEIVQGCARHRCPAKLYGL